MGRHMRSHEIRQRFVDHFAATGHQQLPSGSLVPPDWDQSVLITTAGILETLWGILYSRRARPNPAG